MRKHSQSFIIYLVFGAIIVVFAVNFGPGSSSCSRARSANWAAAVNGEVIRQEEFGQAFNRRIEYERRFRPGALTDGQRLRMRHEIINQLVQARLVAQEAARRGLRVSDTELLEHLRDRYGVKEVAFDTYADWVNRTFRVGVARFEEQVRGEILREKLQELMRSTIRVSASEAKAEFRRENDRAMVTYVRFHPRETDVAEPAQAEIDKLLQDEAKAVEEQFEQERFKHITPKEVQARQIVREVAEDATDAEVAKVRALLLDLKNQIEGGADFAALVKQHSQDADTADKGGDLGLKKRSELPTPIAAAIFSLDKGELVDEPVRTPKGLHLLQVVEVKASTQRKLEEVRNEVAASLLRKRAGDKAAQAQAEALLAKLKKGEKLEGLTWTDLEAREAAEKSAGKARSRGKRPVRRDSAWVLRSQKAVPGIGLAEGLLPDLFGASKDSPLLAKTYKAGEAYYVVTLKERQTPDMAKFEETKDDLLEHKSMVKAARVLGEWLSHVQKEADVELNPAVFGFDDETTGT